MKRVGCEHLTGSKLQHAFRRREAASHDRQAIAQGADHLILDEPTNHLDIRYQVEILELVVQPQCHGPRRLARSQLGCLVLRFGLSAGGRDHRDRRHAGVGHHHRNSPPCRWRRRPHCAAPREGTPHLIPRRSERPIRPGGIRLTPRFRLVTSPGAPQHPLLDCANSQRELSLEPGTSRRLPISRGDSIQKLGAGAIVSAVVLAGHRSRGPAASCAPAGQPATGGFPVTISTAGRRRRTAKAPTRAVSNDINTTEDMLSLGLGSHMVGDFGVNGDGPVGKPVPSSYPVGLPQGEGHFAGLLHAREARQPAPRLPLRRVELRAPGGDPTSPRPTWPRTTSTRWLSPSPVPMCSPARRRSASATRTPT